jgi:anti-anti-sigma factor
MPEVLVNGSVEGSTLVLTLIGDLDLLTVPRCAERINDAIDARPEGCRQVVFDMSRMEFCSAVGIRMLAAVEATCARHDLSTGIVTVPGSGVHRVIGLTCLEQVLPTFTSLDMATG